MPKEILKKEIAQAAQLASHAIAEAAQKALTTIATAAEAAKAAVTTNAAQAAAVLVAKNPDGLSDHDAILKLTTSFDNFKEQDGKDKLLIRNDIRQLGDGIVNRVDIVEKRIEGCFTKFEFGTFMSENHSPLLVVAKNNTDRITGLENSKIRQNVMMSIGIGLLTIVVGLMVFLLERR
jgi:hypothetical protein